MFHVKRTRSSIPGSRSSRRSAGPSPPAALACAGGRLPRMQRASSSDGPRRSGQGGIYHTPPEHSRENRSDSMGSRAGPPSSSREKRRAQRAPRPCLSTSGTRLGGDRWGTADPYPQGPFGPWPLREKRTRFADSAHRAPTSRRGATDSSAPPLPARDRAAMPGIGGERLVSPKGANGAQPAGPRAAAAMVRASSAIKTLMLFCSALRPDAAWSSIQAKKCSSIHNYR